MLLDAKNMDYVDFDSTFALYSLIVFLSLKVADDDQNVKNSSAAPDTIIVSTTITPCYENKRSCYHYKWY